MRVVSVFTSVSALSVALAGCDVFDDALKQRVLGEGPGECATHLDCGGDPRNPIACVEPGGRCVPLLSEDCREVTGSLDADAVVIGALFSLTGPQARANVPRKLAAMMAAEQIGAFGGVPGPGAQKRALVLLSCDEAADLERVGSHLVDALRVPAIVGPNTSQDVIALSNRYSVAGGTLLLSPTAVASSIADLDDRGLTWVMVPSDEQRGQLMVQQLTELEEQLGPQRGERPLKLSIIHRDDVLGTGTRAALSALTLNGMSLLENQNHSPPAVTIEQYDPAVADQAALVARQRAFAPDIVVLAGLAEAVTDILVPLEQSWDAELRPHYVAIDSLKVPELLAAVAGNDDLRLRIRGTGVVPTERSRPVYEAFRLDFQARFPEQPATVSGIAAAYDAVYAIAYALAATRDQPAGGEVVAAGLRKLSGGASLEELRSTKILSAFHELAQGRAIEAVGTLSGLSWNERGAPLGGRLEMWCIGAGEEPAYESSGLTYDVETRTRRGSYQPCGAPPP